MIKKKFILELEEEPALLFVQENNKKFPKVYQDGKEVHGIRNIRIYADVSDLTTHQIEYLTGCTNGKK